MAIGDAVSLSASTASGASLVIQPSAGTEIILHTIGHGGACELYFISDGNTLLIDSDTEAGAWMGLTLHSTATRYYSIKNTDAGTKVLSYDGCVTR